MTPHLKTSGITPTPEALAAEQAATQTRLAPMAAIAAGMDKDQAAVWEWLTDRCGPCIKDAKCPHQGPMVAYVLRRGEWPYNMATNAKCVGWRGQGE